MHFAGGMLDCLLQIGPQWKSIIHKWQSMFGEKILDNTLKFPHQVLYFCYKSWAKRVLWLQPARHEKITSISLFASSRLNHITVSCSCNDNYYWDFCMAIDSPPFILTFFQLSRVLCAYRHQPCPRWKHLSQESELLMCTNCTWHQNFMQ